MDWRRAQRKRSGSIATNGAVFGRPKNRSRSERKRERERTQSGFCNERKGEWRGTGKFHFVDATFSTKLQLEK